MRIVLGLLIVVPGLLMGYSASRYKGPAIQADVDRRTDERLASLETANALETDGRHVTLPGLASSKAAMEQIADNASIDGRSANRRITFKWQGRQEIGG